jgi:hypothetical protein
MEIAILVLTAIGAAIDLINFIIDRWPGKGPGRHRKDD